MALKFKTVAKASGCSMLVYGDAPAISNAILMAYRRLQRVSGWKGGGFKSEVRPLARTGDDRKYLVIWEAL